MYPSLNPSISVSPFTHPKISPQISITETLRKITCKSQVPQLSVYFCYQKNLEKNYHLLTKACHFWYYLITETENSGKSLSLLPTTISTKNNGNKWILLLLTFLWLARFAHSRGFRMGEYGDFVLERNIITTTHDISNIYYNTLCG